MPFPGGHGNFGAVACGHSIPDFAIEHFWNTRRRQLSVYSNSENAIGRERHREMKYIVTLEEASALILSGKRLFVAGDESLLAALPRGQWIGGTIPYFMSEEGGLCTNAKIGVAPLPEFVTGAETRFYSIDDLEKIPDGYKRNGFTRLILPAGTNIHQQFARNCAHIPGILGQPLIGWIAGVNLTDLGRIQPKVFDGSTGKSSAEDAVAMHVELPETIVAKANILNIFQRGAGDPILFLEEGFTATDCLVNGEKKNFAAYVKEKQIDTKLPLVAEYGGTRVNVSFQNVDEEQGIVSFYAPVFPGVEYKVAAPVEDYEAAFKRELSSGKAQAYFTCNCILNYMYGGLEGKHTGNVVGPITFGEIANMLLNQTMVYLTFESYAS
ncbi:DUF6976 family protein [Telmatobacter bradus]|uniref:DUF6976 family protein n=1 Tax=Telmatobacter bradus TaxID=474953 RepID=UPI003B432D0D